MRKLKVIVKDQKGQKVKDLETIKLYKDSAKTMEIKMEKVANMDGEFAPKDDKSYPIGTNLFYDFTLDNFEPKSGDFGIGDGDLETFEETINLKQIKVSLVPYLQVRKKRQPNCSYIVSSYLPCG